MIKVSILSLHSTRFKLIVSYYITTRTGHAWSFKGFFRVNLQVVQHFSLISAFNSWCRQLGTATTVLKGSCCGTVSRAVSSETRNPWFESRHASISIQYCRLYWKELRPANWRANHSLSLFTFSFSHYNVNNTNWKSIDGVLSIRTRGHRMVGADETSELFWLPVFWFLLRML